MEKMLIFSAPSGAGKTTLIKSLLHNNDFNVAFSVSACSRKPRENEKDGVDYFFLTVEDFKNKISNNEFIEWQEVYENQFYGTLKSEVERIWKEGKSVVFDVDVIGGINIKNFYNHKALSIFIKPPSLEELQKRLINRKTETQETLAKRIKKAELELQFENKFDVVVVNDELAMAEKITCNYIKIFLAK